MADRAIDTQMDATLTGERYSVLRLSKREGQPCLKANSFPDAA